MDDLAQKAQARESEEGEDEAAPHEVVRVPRQRDPERTRRVILDAATVEFVAHGFAGASVNEIAARAQVNKRMLYHYYGKKDDLYLAVLERSYTGIRSAETQLHLTDLPPADAIERLVLFTWSYFLEHPEFLSLRGLVGRYRFHLVLGFGFRLFLFLVGAHLSFGHRILLSSGFSPR